MARPERLRQQPAVFKSRTGLTPALFDALAAIPVMVVSGADPARAREAVQSAADCVRKPVELGELEAKVRRLTGPGEQAPAPP
jgi:CheY-like chemotaxis protein